MKATRKLIPAIAMLLISAVMMSTATFAWFSTNQTVTASGMQISAKANNAFLVISESNVATAPNSKETSVSLTSSVGSVIPATAFSTTASGTTAGKKDDASTSIHWYTGTAAAANKTDLNTQGYSGIDEGALQLYTVSGKFYIRSAAGFPTATNLRLTGFWVGNESEFSPAVSVVLKVTGLTEDGTADTTKYYIYEGAERGVKAVGEGEDTPADNDVLSAFVHAGKDVIVEFYIYINGDDQNVYTDKAVADNLDAMTVTMTFGIDGIIAASVPDND